MATDEVPDRPAGSLLADAGQYTAGAAFHDKLQLLLSEVTSLANQLRRTGSSVPQQANSAVGGWSVLQVLDRLGPLTVPAIARIRAVSRQNIQTLVNRLEAHGYVALGANPAHKKSGLVQLTDHGRRLLAAATAREFKSSEALLPHVSETRLVRAARLLGQLRKLLSGNALPPAEVTGKRSAREHVGALPRRVRRSETRPAPADLSPPPEPAEPDAAEFPLSLL